MAAIASPVEGTNDSGYDATRVGLEIEQECLFFVPLSRAEDRLFLYRYQTQSSGRRQSASKFLKLLGSLVKELPFESGSSANSDSHEYATRVSIEKPFQLTDYQIALYDKCPTRFLYAHVLKVGGRRTETAYMLLHDAVQDVVNAVASAAAGPISLKEAESMLDEAMTDRGFDADAAAAEYRSIAAELVHCLVARSANGEIVAVSPTSIEILGGSVEVKPDQIVRRADGIAVFRRIRTGHAASKADKSLEAALLQMSALHRSLI